MAADPWAVVQNQPAEAAPANDPWAVKTTAPVSAPAPKAAAPTSPPADDPLHQIYGWLQKNAQDKIAEYNAGPKPRVPDMPDPLGEIANQIVHHAHALMPWQPFGQPSADDGVFGGIVKGAANMATRGIDSAVAPVRKVGSVANDALAGAQSSLVTKPISQATGVPEDQVNLALMAGLPEKPVDAAAGRPAPKGRRTAETPPSEGPAPVADPWAVKAEAPVAPEAAAPDVLSELEQQRQGLAAKLKDAYATAEADKPLADTRGQGVQYHGARGPVGELGEGYYQPNNIYGGYDTFYTTDAADVAHGYGRKNPAQAVYSVHEKAPVTTFDMERPLTDAEASRLLGTDVNGDDAHFLGMAWDEAKGNKPPGENPNLREVMDEARGISRGEGVSKDEVQDHFDDVVQRLKGQGYGAMSHQGGLQTGASPHTVKIYFEPWNQIDLKPHAPLYGEGVRPKHQAAIDDLRAQIQPIQDRILAERAKAPPKITAERLAADFDAETAHVPPPKDPWSVKSEIPAEPGPILEPRPKTGDTVADQSVRADDALNRLVKNADADKIEARQYLEAQPPEVADPAVQAKLYGEIEARMVNPDAPLSPEAQVAFDALKPWKDEETQLGQKLADMGYGEEHSIDPNAYVHRVAQGQGSYLDATEAAGRDPVLGDRQGPGTRSLSRSTSSQQSRKFFVLEDARGNRQFVQDPAVAATLKHGEPVWDQTNQTAVTPKYATTAEIEANTGQRYVKNALVNTVDNVLRLRRAARNADVLEGLKTQLGKNGLIHFDQTPGSPPENYVRLTMPQFKGAFADPRIAHTLNDFHGELARGGDLVQLISKANRALTGAIFITPVPHMWNVANHWAIARGFDWLRPGAYKNLMLDGGRAVRAVLTQNDDYQRMLREGSGLMYGGVLNRDFHAAMVKKLGGDILADPKGWTPVAKMFGFANPASLVKTIYRMSSKALWSVSDMFMLQRQFELMRKGMPVREAIHEAEKDIPNYRMPSHIGGDQPANRALAEVLKNPNLFMFGRYRYGQFKAYAHLAKDLAGKDVPPGTRKEAAGRLFIMAAMAMGGYPILDAVVQKTTGNKDAHVHRGGGMSIPAAIHDMATGEKSWGQGMSSIVQPGPVADIAMEVLNGKDGIGRNIIEPGSTAKGKIMQGAEYAGSKVAPVNTAMQALRPDGGAVQAAGNLVALSIPRAGSEANKAKAKFYDARRAARREARDPVARALGGRK